MTARIVGEASLSGDGSTWAVSLEPHAMIVLKKLFQKVAKGELGTVKLAHTPATARDIDWFFQRYPVTMTDADRHVLEGGVSAHIEQETLVARMLAAGYAPPLVENMALPPRDYQALAADVAYVVKSLLLGDQLGTGKTVSAIALLCKPDTLPAMVVTLTPIPYQWEAMVNRFAPHLRTHVLKKGTPYDLTHKPYSRSGAKLPFPDVIITSYSKLIGWAEHLAALGINTLIADEAHELRHSGTDRYRAWLALRARAKYCLGMTATPVFGMGSRIFYVVDAIRPGALGTWKEFVREWCDGNEEDDKPAVKDPDALGAYLRREGLMLRRTRAEVKHAMPPIQRLVQPVEVDLDPINAMRSRATELAKIILSSGGSGFTKMEASKELDWRLRQATGIGKAKFVAEFVEMILKSGEKVLLSGWHREVYSIWAEALAEYRPAFYTGSETTAQKAESVRRFCDPNHPDPTPLLIISLRSGAGLDGLQFSGCAIVVHGELDWIPAVHDQMDGRIDRDGQPRPVTVYYLIGDAGSDPILQSSLGIKAMQAHGITDPNTKRKMNTAEQQAALRDRVKRMAASYLAGKGIEVPAITETFVAVPPPEADDPFLQPQLDLEPRRQDPTEAPDEAPSRLVTGPEALAEAAALPETPGATWAPVEGLLARRVVRRGRGQILIPEEDEGHVGVLHNG